MAKADDAVEIDGIYYNLIEKGKVAEVTRHPNGYNLTGSLVIPASIIYNGEEYRVTKIVDSTDGAYWNGVFSNCYNLTSVSLPGTLRRIGSCAFAGCNRLTEIEIPDGVKEIGNAVFYLSGLTSVSIPSSVTIIEGGAFRDLTSLKSVNITDLESWCNISFGDNGWPPFGGTVADSNARYHLYLNGEEIKDLKIPNSITTIRANTFYGCIGLTSVTIPEGVLSIGNRAFYGCSNLISIAIPKTLSSIGSEAFRFCNKLSSVQITDLEAWCQISFEGSVSSNYLISNPLYYAHHLFLNGEEIKDLVIPNSVTMIKNLAFCGCRNFTSISIPSSVKYIGSGAFAGCSSITSLNIPNSVTAIYDSAFYECSSLSSLIIGNGINYIFSKAFSECKELSEVYCYAENIPNNNNDYYHYDFTTDFFENSYIEYCTLNVPSNSVNAYKTTQPWSDFGTINAIEGGGTQPEEKLCATPTISYADKKLTFSCETEGVEYVYEITDVDIKKGYDAEVDLTATYNISVYATKSGYTNSDVATATLVWTNAIFTETTPETPTSAKAVQESIPVLISAKGGNISVKCEADGQEVNVYTIDGLSLGTATVKNGEALISTSIPSGDIAVVKVGGRSVKVIMR